jgi:hypothetical protein
MKRLTLIGVLTLLVVSAPLSASIVAVNGNMNIFGAGHPAAPFNGMSTEGALPILAASGLTGGQALTIATLSGSTSCGASAPCNVAIGADGAALVFSVGPTNGTDVNALAGANVGISGIIFNGRDMFLTGVFIGASEPTGNGPAITTYTSAVDAVGTFSPLLGQAFYIGDGRTGFNNSIGGLQQFIAPTGATRLYLGFMDAFNNFVGFPGAFTDNTGTLQVDVNVVPEPGTIMLMGLGLVGVAMLRKKFAR